MRNIFLFSFIDRLNVRKHSDNSNQTNQKKSFQFNFATMKLNVFSSNGKSRRFSLCTTAQCKTIRLITSWTTSGKRHLIHIPSKDVDLPGHKDVFCICRSSQETYFISPSINGLLRGNQRLIEREYHRLIWFFFYQKISENADM